MTFKPVVKIWGITTPLIVTPMFELHRLRVKSWARCSQHVHQFKHNSFYVVSGTLFIDTAYHGETLNAIQCLHAGDTYTIEPGVDHQFRTGEDACLALEMYYTEPLSEDIIRRNVGSVLERHR